jgi:cytochrome c oxidase subunit II
MKGTDRLRRLSPFILTAALAIIVGACSGPHPNTTFTPHTDFGREIDALWNRLLLLGTIVFVLVEAALIFVIFRYRRNDSPERPPQTHGSTKLEILWTLIPAVILVFIAIPTVRTIFKTQAKAPAGSLEVEVIGHQWWWEFKYPEYGITTANEVYLPTGRTVNFTLHSADVIHSFWAPQLGGKRDAVTNHTNYLWYTPDSSMETSVWNGFCAEYCGTSHANMRFRVFTVKPDEFARWAAWEKTQAAFGAKPAAAPTATASSTPETMTAAATPAAAPFIFPKEKIPAYTIPATPPPAGLAFTAGLTGNAGRGQQIFSTGACIGCHTIAGNPSAMGVMGPNLTHVGSRPTIAAGRYPNAAAYLALWIKNARVMKPGVLMPTLGLNEYDPILKSKVTAASGGLTDQQIADVVAYLTALK